MKIVIIMIISSLLFFYAKAQETTKEQDIQELLDLTGSAKLGIQMATKLMDSFKTTYRDVPQEFWDDFIKEMKDDEFEKLMIPIYDKYYTQEEIRELIKFYKSPIGKKTIELMPKIMNESYEVGSKWGEKISKKILEKLKKKGFI